MKIETAKQFGPVAHVPLIAVVGSLARGAGSCDSAYEPLLHVCRRVARGRRHSRLPPGDRRSADHRACALPETYVDDVLLTLLHDRSDIRLFNACRPWPGGEASDQARARRRPTVSGSRWARRSGHHGCL